MCQATLKTLKIFVFCNFENAEHSERATAMSAHST